MNHNSWDVRCGFGMHIRTLYIDLVLNVWLIRVAVSNGSKRACVNADGVGER